MPDSGGVCVGGVQLNRLDGKIAIVTGSTQGLGEEIAYHFAQAGVSGLVICGRNAGKGRTVAKSIEETSETSVKFVQADLGIVDDCRTVVDVADNEFGRVDILVNAAAITDRGNLLNTTPELFDQIYSVNVRGPFFLMQETVKIMIRERIPGSIVNIGSMSALSGQPFIIAYCTSKGALATLTRNAGFSLLRNRIRVNQLNIGWMYTDGEDRIQKRYHGATDDWALRAGQELPVGRLIDPAEVAKAVAFLVSDDSGIMTGSIINFDQSVWGASDGAPAAPVDALCE